MINLHPRFFMNLINSEAPAEGIAWMANRSFRFLAGAASVFLLVVASAMAGEPDAIASAPSKEKKDLTECQRLEQIVEEGLEQVALEKAQTAIKELRNPSSFHDDLKCLKRVVTLAHAKLDEKNLSECDTAKLILAGGGVDLAIKRAEDAISKLKEPNAFEADLQCLNGVLARAKSELISSGLETAKTFLAKKQLDNAKQAAEETIGKLNKAAATFDDDLKHLQAVLAKVSELEVRDHCAAVEAALAKKLPQVAEKNAKKLIDEIIETRDRPAFYKGLQCLAEVLEKAKKETEKQDKEKIEKVISYYGNLGDADKVKQILEENIQKFPDLKLSSEARSTFDIRIPLWQQLHGQTADALLMPSKGLVTKLSIKEKAKKFLSAFTIVEFGVLVIVAAIMWRKLVWAKPSLAIDGFKELGKADDNRADFDAWVRAQLMEMTMGRGKDRSLTFLRGPISDVEFGADLPQIPRGLGPIFKYGQSIYNLLVKRRYLQVDGVLMGFASNTTPEGTNDASVEVQMRRGGKVIAEAIIRAQEFEQKGARRLAELVGIWIAFECTRHNTTMIPGLWNWLRSYVGPVRRLLGTKDWQSYALAHSALRAMESEPAVDDNKVIGLENAQTLLKRALERDPDFLAARVNLGTLLRKQTLKGATGSAVYDPKGIYELLNADPQLLPGWYDMVVKANPASFAHLFLSSAVALDVACECRKARSESGAQDAVEWLTRALNHANKLMGCLNEAQLLALRSEPKDFLAWRQPIARSLQLGLAVKAQAGGAIEKRLTSDALVASTKTQDELRRLEKVLGARFDYSSLYNLACSFAICCEYASQEKQKRDWAGKALRYLKRSQDLAEAVTTSKVEAKFGDQQERIRELATADCAFEFIRSSTTADLGLEGETARIFGDFFGTPASSGDGKGDDPSKDV